MKMKYTVKEILDLIDNKLDSPCLEDLAVETVSALEFWSSMYEDQDPNQRIDLIDFIDQLICSVVDIYTDDSPASEGQREAIEDIKETKKKESQRKRIIQHYVDKYDSKMRDASYQEAYEWVSGINAEPEIEEEVMRRIFVKYFKDRPGHKGK